MTGRSADTQEQYLKALEALAWQALRHYRLPSGTTVRLFNMSENATFRVDALGGHSWALRIHRHGYHSRLAIASELAWAVELRRSGVVTTPRPVAGLDGELIQLVSHPGLAQPRHVVLFEWEDGAEPGITEDLREPMEVLGETAARMHLQALQWTRPSWFTRFTWDFDTSLGEVSPHWGHWRDGLGMTAEKEALFARTVEVIRRRLSAYGKGHERFGLAHCDLRLANLLIDGKAVKVLDFDDCGFGWLMYDAATPFSFHEHEAQVPELLECWKQGYRRVKFLAPEDEAEIPTLIMLRRILLVAWVASHAEAEYPRSLGSSFTDTSLPLCEKYLSIFSRD